MLFACSENAVRSAMAEAILKHLHGRQVFVDSCGVRAATEVDPFAVEVLAEIGMDLSRHRPKSFDDLQDDFVDLIVSLSPEAHHRAIELTRVAACDVEYWPVPDATLAEGSRDARLAAYREVRDLVLRRIRERFPPRPRAAP